MSRYRSKKSNKPAVKSERVKGSVPVKVAEVMLRRYASDDDSRPALTSLLVGDGLVCATNTHHLAYVGTPAKLRTTDPVEARVAIASAKIRKASRVLPDEIPAQADEKGVPGLGRVLVESKPTDREICLNPRYLRDACDLAIANGARSIRIVFAKEGQEPGRPLRLKAHRYDDIEGVTDEVVNVLLMPMANEDGGNTGPLVLIDPDEPTKPKRLAKAEGRAPAGRKGGKA